VVGKVKRLNLKTVKAISQFVQRIEERSRQRSQRSGSCIAGKCDWVLPLSHVYAVSKKLCALNKKSYKNIRISSDLDRSPRVSSIPKQYKN
jgi:hypothetical protein